jgi:hypothetical protein
MTIGDGWPSVGEVKKEFNVVQAVGGGCALIGE